MQYNTIQYNTNFIVNSPWGLFRDNDKDNFKKYSKIIVKQ